MTVLRSLAGGVSAAILSACVVGCAGESADQIALDNGIKNEIRILGEKAKLNAPWSGAQIADIDSEVESAQHLVDLRATK